MRPYRLSPDDLDRWGTLPDTITVISRSAQALAMIEDERLTTQAWIASHAAIIAQAKALKPNIDNVCEFTDGYIFSNQARERTLEGDAPVVILKFTGEVIPLAAYREIVECDTEVYSCQLT